MSQQQPSRVGAPGRYQRSTGGLVGAVIVMVVLVLLFVAFRAFFRQTPTYTAPEVDYLSTVEVLQQAGTDVVYPRDLPSGWSAKDVHVTPGARPSFDLSLTTADGSFAGLHEGYETRSSLLTTYVDPAPTQVGEVQVDGSVAATWTGYADDGGDHAFVAEVGSGTDAHIVLVYGSADADELRDLLGRLTTEPVENS